MKENLFSYELHDVPSKNGDGRRALLGQQGFKRTSQHTWCDNRESAWHFIFLPEYLREVSIAPV